MLALYAHPLSSYCWKVLIALRELGLDYELRMLDPDHPEIGAEFARRWPIAKMPLLLDGDRAVAESSVIIEYLGQHPANGHSLIPPAPEDALQVRFLDRVFDNYVMTPMNTFTLNRLRPEPDVIAEQQAGVLLDKTYAWLEREGLGPGAWAHGDSFTLADCAAFPALYYAGHCHPRGDAHPRLDAYVARLLARPSIARTVAEARPYWHLYPYADG